MVVNSGGRKKFSSNCVLIFWEVLPPFHSQAPFWSEQ